MTDTTFLEHFEQARRSLIANMFCRAVRDGAETVDAVISSVKGDAQRRLLTGDREQQTTQRLLLSLLDGQEALAFAQRTLEWEKLSFDQKDLIKRARAEEYKRLSMRARPATEKQLSFLRALGCHTTPSHRQHASELIGKYKAR